MSTQDKNAKETLVVRLRRLHQEYARALGDIGTDQDRKLEDAFRAVNAEMSAIENEANEAIRKVCEEYQKTDESTAQPGAPGQAYWDCQKRIAEITAEARKKAEATRTKYLENWKNIATEFTVIREKAARDFLGRIHDAWRTADLGAADAATVDELVCSLTAAFAC